MWVTGTWGAFTPWSLEALAPLVVEVEQVILVYSSDLSLYHQSPA